jgi:beta-N-acetylhexosaminidase
MIITFGEEKNKDQLQKMLIGGVYFGAKPSKDDYVKATGGFQDGATVPLFITVDMEGCANPFENFRKFPGLREIGTSEQAYQVGLEEGKALKEMGFNLNFAPVVDLSDNVWKCRNFLGTPEEVSEKANGYITGLQESGIMATPKHYPGATLSAGDLHKYSAYASVDANDLLPFENAIKDNASAIMVSHTIVSGSLDSEAKPSDVSVKLVGGLRDGFAGLIVTDEINMQGLKSHYSDIDAMYVDLFKADNDLVLNFNSDPRVLDHMITVVEGAVKSGEISEDRIDASVTRILAAKGINVVQ